MRFPSPCIWSSKSSSGLRQSVHDIDAHLNFGGQYCSVNSAGESVAGCADCIENQTVWADSYVTDLYLYF